MTRGSWWRWARPLGGAVILGVLLARLGTDAFVEGVRATDARTLLLGAAVAAVTTTCAAWRWRLVARVLDAELSMPSAVAACYRAQFLNVTLPGGVLGDVDRGVHHGREVDDVGRGLRGVAWERASGQVVLAVVTVAALLQGRVLTTTAVLVPVAVLAVAGLVLLGVARAGRGTRRGTGVGARAARVAAADARALLSPVALAGIAVASLAVLAGHVATFLLAARTVGVRMPVVELVPLALLVLLVAAVPLNLAGWGPREGAAAWVFAAAGVGAAQGLAVSVAYGVIVLVATLPGAVLLLAGRSRRSSSPSGDRPARTGPTADTREVTAHG
ncbi:MAG TPA: lysylphosphatidylglycerol synthase domain-containing protein [Ornithinibacter sp.]|nr:lysylphosphatidylglycerol synthase domain-containing protein [Ornithinibacter sp.]